MHNYLPASDRIIALSDLSHLELFLYVCYTYTSIELGVAGVIGSFFTVVEVAKIITLWPRHERCSNSWKINERIRSHYMGFLATLITAATERS